MLRLFFRRLLQSSPTAIGASLIAFAVIRLAPGDPVIMMLGERGSSPEVVEELRHKLGLDQPLTKQYALFIFNALRGDFGESVVSRRPVLDEFLDRFPATVELSFAALTFGILLGLPMGIWAAIRRGRPVDYSLMGFALVGYSMPIFWLGLVLILVFSITLGWTPVSGRMDALYDLEPWSGFMLIDVWVRGLGWPAFLDTLHHLCLPVIALGTAMLAAIARMTRSSLLEVLREDYIRTAHAKGLGPRQVIGVHALKNALIPILTIIGLMLGTVLTGAVLTETIFSWPGVGRWLVASVIARDYPVIQAGVLLVSLFVILVNVTVDWSYALVNPSLRKDRK